MWTEYVKGSQDSTSQNERNKVPCAQIMTRTFLITVADFKLRCQSV